MDTFIIAKHMKVMINRIVLTCILVCFMKLCIYSQETSGYVLDEKNMPLPFSTIIIQDKVDTAFVIGDVTDSLGHFSLRCPSAYKMSELILKVSNLGYKAQILPLKSDMGHIIMESESHLLNEVTIKGNLPITRLHNGAIVNRIQGTILANLGTIEDVMTKLPLVIKRDDHFEVLGKGVPLIYINNKKVIDMSELCLLHPNEIKNIAIYNSSNVQYDSSSRAIIKIETIKNKKDGLNLNTNLGLIQSTKLSNRAQIDFSYQHRNLNIFGILSYKSSYKKGVDKQDVTAESDTLWEQERNTTQYVKEKELLAKTGFNYDFNTNNTIGMSYSYGRILKRSKESTYTSNVWANKKLFDLLSVDYVENNNDKPTHQAEIYYTGKIRKVNIDANMEYYSHAYSLNRVR